MAQEAKKQPAQKLQPEGGEIFWVGMRRLGSGHIRRYEGRMVNGEWVELKGDENTALAGFMLDIRTSVARTVQRFLNPLGRR